MRSKLICLAAALGASLSTGQNKFALTGINVPLPASRQRVFIEVTTSGPPPARATLQDPGEWEVYAELQDRTQVRLTRPASGMTMAWIPDTANVRISFDSKLIQGRDPRTLGWIVVFKGVNPNLQTTFAARKTLPETTACAPFKLASAKGKDDADVYLFGSYLAGYSTKPIYTIDGKLNLLTEICTEGSSHPTGWFWGLKSDISTNTSAQAPVDRTRVDPDSIDGSLSFTRFKRRKANSENQRVIGYYVDLDPLSGEFARKYPASNLLTKGSLMLGLAPWPIGKKLQAVLYPSAGYELGRNLNKPGILFKRPVDLSDWNGIARATFRTKFELFGVQPTVKPGNVYRFTLDATYQPRVLFTQEPFVDLAYVNGQRVKLTRLERGTRQEIEAGENWNFSEFAAVRLQYRYGALPPLFEFVDHQVTVGLTFKAKQANKP